MPMERPTYFKKVLQTIKKLSTSKGFSIRQIAEHLIRLGIKRNPKDIRTIVEQSVKYGVKNKLLQEKCGKFHLTAARLQSQVHSTTEKKKKKRVRFKKGKTNINDALNNYKNKRQKRRKTSKRKNSRKSSRSRQKNCNVPIETSSENGETTEPTNQEMNSSANESKTELIVERKESKEALNVTPDRDVHDNCVNKNRDRSKQQSNVREPPQLESETEIGWQPPRPATKLSRRSHSRSRHSSKLRKDLTDKYKHSHSHLKEQRKRLRDFIPDDKTYRKYKTRSRRHHNLEKSEESSECDLNFTERKCRKCHSHFCTCKSKKHSYHQRKHYNSDNYLLERKISNTILDHLNKSKTVLDTIGENLTPFEVFLEANHNELETIAENISVEDEHTEEAENEAKDCTSTFSPSYIN